MPKKRHYAKYSKPQSTAPHSLESSGRQSNIHHEEPQSRSVNDILANLRRAAHASHVNAAYAADGGLLHQGPAGHGFSRRPALSPISAVNPSPSVPPEIAHILLPGLPHTLAGGGLPHHAGAAAGALAGPAAAAHGPAGAPAGAAAAGALRRRPAGPAPPPSWLAQSRHAPRHASSATRGSTSLRSSPTSALAHQGLDMPGISRPAKGSLVDRALRCMALEWHIQKHYNQYYLLHLQGPLRAAIVSYLGQQGKEAGGVSIGDLKALLLPPLLPSGGGGGGGGDNGSGEQVHTEDLPSPSTLNEDFRYLDLTGAVGQSLSIKELSDLLFPGGSAGFWARRGANGKGKQREAREAKGTEETRQSRGGHVNGLWEDDDGLVESWDLPGVHSPPRALLPNLTHLSLALDPDRSAQASWRHLLAFASHLPMLTHLRLAYWPEPTLTPNVKRTTVVSPQGRRIPYGGTGFYSHTLDNDWAEAVLLVRKLSKALYGLEYLDLTGCAAWFPALMKRVDSDQVDWAGDWGKITTLVLAYGPDGSVHDDDLASVPEDVVQELRAAEAAERATAAATAKGIEVHIRRQRAGQGRFITVEDAPRRR